MTNYVAKLNILLDQQIMAQMIIMKKIYENQIQLKWRFISKKKEQKLLKLYNIINARPLYNEDPKNYPYRWLFIQISCVRYKCWSKIELVSQSNGL